MSKTSSQNKMMSSDVLFFCDQLSKTQIDPVYYNTLCSRFSNFLFSFILLELN